MENAKNSQKSASDSTSDDKNGKNALEWTVFALSSLIITSVISFLVWQIFTKTDGPPRLEIALSEPQKAGENWLFPVDVKNKGATTALDVQVEVAWKTGGEKASLSFTHLPREGQRRGYVVFSAKNGENPRTSELSAKILGYGAG